MRRELIEKIERRRELKRKLHEAVRSARRKKLLESVIERKEVSRERRHGLSARLHESKLRRERLLESLKERRQRRLAEGRVARRARLAEGLAKRTTRTESLDLENKLNRKSRIRHLMAKNRLRGYEDWEDREDLEESRKERRQRIMEKIKALRGKKALKEDEIDIEVQDTPDELGAGIDGEELDADLLLGESKEVKADIKQLNESKRFQTLINKYLAEGTVEDKEDEEDKDDKECKDGECKDGECKDKKSTAKKSIKEKIKACKERKTSKK